MYQLNKFSIDTTLKMWKMVFHQLLLNTHTQNKHIDNPAYILYHIQN